MKTAQTLAIDTRLPGWVPEAARTYLAHTEDGMSIRAIARARDCHASTILRQVRRYENRRDDPLVDDALRRLSQQFAPSHFALCKEQDAMQSNVSARSNRAVVFPPDPDLSVARIEREALRVLRRLSETGAVLAVARDMEMAVVVRDTPDGATQRTAVTEREIAQALALRDWISCNDTEARIARYHLTALGRSALKQLMAKSENRAQGFGEAASDFAKAARLAEPDDEAGRCFRTQAAESPLAALARRRDKDGQLFLSRDLVNAGERLREDFELSSMSGGPMPDWQAVMGGHCAVAISAKGASQAARQRVAAALVDLGPGLGDVVLRCCCLLEGLETAERNMGWAARSGKIVLRIGLQRLKRHYADQGSLAPKIG